MVVVDPLTASSEGHSSVNDPDVPATDPTSPTLSDAPVNDEHSVSIVGDQSTPLLDLGPASTEDPAKDDFTPAPIPDSDVTSNLSRTEPLPDALATQEAVTPVEPQATGGTKECLTPIQNLDIYETLEPEEPFSTVRRSTRRTQSKQHQVPAPAEELQNPSSSVAGSQAAGRSRRRYPQRRVWFEVYRNWASVPDREKDEMLERVQDPEAFWMKTMSNLSEWSPPLSQTGDTIQWFY
ncbi:hypothetical protein FIBSPDRAFT_159165 [Athelia psychrophila]|uniref:Uncharacterized protein n=1 Tax=Athelia psychrophila TaxID=1759441 RepID=A0A166SUB0_9AGAM|nr:hypothetical protein FIBSPDRAFT_159165 [Fibularhizoctonia sp. CBS 109695]